MAAVRGVCSQLLLTIVLHLLILEYLHAQQTDNSKCEKAMYITVTVDKTVTVSWYGEDREGTVAVYVTTEDTYGRTCDNKVTRTAEFEEKKLSLENPCSNAVYSIGVSLTCNGASYHRQNVTVRTPPDAPTVLKMKPSNSSMRVEWSKPPGKILTYRAMLIGGRKKINVWQNETAETFWNFASLEPYTEYKASVMAKNEDHWSVAGPLMTARTLEGAPFEPENLTAVDISTDEIILKWDNPEPETGAILWFEVAWTENDGKENTPQKTKENTYAMRNLFPYTRYEIKVSAVNSIGKGPASAINVTTKMAVPDPPFIEVMNRTNTSILVHWKLPDSYRGPDPSYELKVARQKQLDTVQTLKIREGDRVGDYNLSELLPDTTYQIQMKAENAAGPGRWSNVVETKTLVGVPSAPDNLDVDSKTSTSIAISWKVPDPPNGIILRYMVKWRVRSQPKQINETDTNRFEATELSPYTEYDFQVCAQTDAGWGNWSRVLKARTDVGVPSEPLNLTEAGVTNSTIFIQWQVPKHKNGPHLDYIIRWVKVGDDFDDNDSSETSTVTFFLEGSFKDEVVESFYEITNLESYTNYSIEVCAKTTAGEGNYTQPLIIQTTAGIPSSPKSLKTVQVRPTSLTVQWLSPETTNGPLLGYVLHWGLTGTEASQIKVHGNSYKALGLRPYTEYFFKIAAETEGGQGPFTTILKRTDISSPSAPTNLAPVTVTDQCVLLSWSLPEHPNAPRLRYVVRWSETFGDSPTQVHHANVTSFMIRELAPLTNYTMQVSGESDAGQGPWTPPIYVRTGPKDHSSAIIAGSVVGGLIVLAIIGSVIIFFLAKQKGGLKNLIPHSKPKSTNSSETLKTTDMPISLDVLHETGKISVRDFDQHVLNLMSNGYYRLAQEFEKLGKESPGFLTDEAKKSDNLTKNRWVKILPFDYSRVKLRPVGDEIEPDFINASYIPGDSHLLEYIATQGPLPNTVNDFWRLVWQESVFLMVMLTQCVERAKRTCERYWPAAGSSQRYGDVEVHSVSESITPLYIQRLLLVSMGGKQRHVVHLHYMNWPVSGCPKSPEDFLSFVKTFRSQMSCSVTGPTLVHCSAGIGRTGTFIAVDRLLQQINRQCEEVDVYGTVLELRKYRANLVQTEEQYYFIHLCIQRIIQEKREELENDYEGGIYSN